MANEVLLSNIKELCRNRNITVAFLEKELDIGAGTISRWNKANPSIDRVMAIARFFEVSLDDLTGYVSGQAHEGQLGEQTKQIIDYLTVMTNQARDSKSFWRYYGEDEQQLRISKIQEHCGEKDNILYACDDTGFYLLVVSYVLNNCYEYEMVCRLYLIPDEGEEPILECNVKEALRGLVIEALNQLKSMKQQKELKEKVNKQREKIIKKYNELL